MLQLESEEVVAEETAPRGIAVGFEQDPSVAEAILVETSHLRIPSRPEWIIPTVEYLAERAVRCGACPQDRETGLTVALHEALTNSVVHGNLELSSALKEQGDSAFAEALATRAADPVLSSRLVDIRTVYDGDCCRWTLVDQGRGFDVAAALARASSDDPEILLASGRGIVLMQAMLDEVNYEAGGRRLELVLRRGGSERRRHERRPAHDTVRVAPVNADGSVAWNAAYNALSRNLSEGGMSVLQARLTTTPRVLIGLDWEGEVLYVPAEVRHCETLGGGLVQFGCRFAAEEGILATAKKIPGADVEAAIGALLDQTETPPLARDERRAHQRVVYTKRIGISGGPGPTVGFARNLSKGGISFMVHKSLPLEGRTVSLPLGDGEALHLRIQVVRCEMLMNGVYEVGARFVGLASD